MPAVLFCDTMRPLSDNCAKSVAKTLSKLMPDIDTFENTKKTAEKMLKESGLEAKGVKILYVDDSAASLGKLEEIINKATKGGFIGDRIRSQFYQMLKHGANAAYADKTNTVIVSAKNLYSSIYHELGHAMNANCSTLTKILQKSRCITPMGISLVAPVALVVGLFHKTDKNSPKADTKTNKTLDFIAKHAGLLTLASYLPMVAEEGLASIRGINQAKKYLDKNIVNKLKLNYTKALGTYALTAALVAGAVDIGVSTANNIKKRNKNNN